MDSRPRRGRNISSLGYCPAIKAEAQSVAEITSVEYETRVHGGCQTRAWGQSAGERCATCMGSYEECPGHGTLRWRNLYSTVTISRRCSKCSTASVITAEVAPAATRSGRKKAGALGLVAHLPRLAAQKRVVACLAETPGTQCTPRYGATACSNQTDDMINLCIIATFEDGTREV